MYYEFEAGNNVYKLRINLRNIASLEKKIGINPIMIFGIDGDKIPEVTTMVAILHASLQQYQNGITIDKAYDIFESWMGDGHLVTDFIPEIIEIYKVSGIMKDETGDEKNA